VYPREANAQVDRLALEWVDEHPFAATARSETDGPESENRARFCFTVPEDGIYYIKGWVYAANTNSNSLYVTVNDSPRTGYEWHTIDFSNQDDVSYRADHVINRVAENYVALNLESGPQIVTFYPREAGIRLDKVALTPTTASLLAKMAAENAALGFIRDTEGDVSGTQQSYNLYLPVGVNKP